MIRVSRSGDVELRDRGDAYLVYRPGSVGHGDILLLHLLYVDSKNVLLFCLDGSGFFFSLNAVSSGARKLCVREGFIATS
jgi:hypothetical protein